MKKGNKWSFQTLNTCLVAEFSLAEIGGTPPPPLLTENHPTQKPLAEMGDTPPLSGKDLLSSF